MNLQTIAGLKIAWSLSAFSPWKKVHQAMNLTLGLLGVTWGVVMVVEEEDGKIQNFSLNQNLALFMSCPLFSFSLSSMTKKSYKRTAAKITVLLSIKSLSDDDPGV